MRKTILIGVVLLLGLALLANAGYGYDMSGEFQRMIGSNPLDAAYDRESKAVSNGKDWGTQTWVELETKYAKLWDGELNAIYRKLLAVLSPGEQAKLRTAQRGWLQYHRNEAEFVAATLLATRKDGPILGSQGRVDSILAYKNRIRSRTLELMEYFYLLRGEVRFVYREP
ncbi:uncharacterized protein DUF1311 [Hydrogenispora ethanolica]|jgi:uncharacterized protein YecT (DUF1311 family)|uniref:Uncharacterized protein DUF1311 n=1 Tax=Hydrogenispora ethanolica TaxID=1082276 RepID=A0A4R1R9N5_HYDET|nr:lysozyme inhibitor LprI family protein [Hydrogenispora ethanolica]TCL62082.1 uncharacterized protein DUF1311 [Hydrogenispora ethanolica]